MPKKGHKAASRQNQLNRRRRRFRDHNKPTQPDVLGPEDSPRSNLDYAHQTGEAKVFDGSSEIRENVTRPKVKHNSKVGEALPPLKYQYLGKEIKRIGSITSLVVLILIILTFVLAG